MTKKIDCTSLKGFELAFKQKAKLIRRLEKNLARTITIPILVFFFFLLKIARRWKMLKRLLKVSFFRCVHFFLPLPLVCPVRRSRYWVEKSINRKEKKNQPKNWKELYFLFTLCNIFSFLNEMLHSELFLKETFIPNDRKNKADILASVKMRPHRLKIERIK